MKRAFFALLMAVCLLALCGCNLLQYSSGPVPLPGPYIEEPASTPLPAVTPAPAPSVNTDDDSYYGSVGLPQEQTILFSVYLHNDYAAWSEEYLQRSRANMYTAASWLQVQSARYGGSFELVCDDEPDDPFYLEAYYPYAFVGGEEADEGNDFYAWCDAYCADAAAQMALAQDGYRYGFLFFLPTDGVAHTIVHYAEDGAYYYDEYCVLYAEDAYSDPDSFDSPAVYAHEILHLYGAADLYEDSPDACVSADLTEYVLDNYPDAIMYDTYDAYGELVYDTIVQKLSPITAYRVGLTDLGSYPFLAQFPALTGSTPGVFADSLPAAGSAGGKWDSEWGGGVAVRPAG